MSDTNEPTTHTAPQPMTRKGANLRAIGLIAAAMLAFLSASEDFQRMAPAWVRVSVGMAAVGFINWRTWLDNSSGRVPARETETTEGQTGQ